MTEPVSAIVACPECDALGTATDTGYVIVGFLADGRPEMLHAKFGDPCPRCKGTGLLKIRALAEDVPTIDRIPEENE